MSNSNRVTCAGTTSNLKRKSFEALGEQLSSYLPSRRAGCTQDMQERQDKKEIEEVNGIEEVQEGQATYEVTTGGQEAQEVAEISNLHNGLNNRINKAVASCVIRSGSIPGDNDALFDLARRIKAIGVRLGPSVLWNIVETWKRANRSNLQPEFDYYTAFLEKLSQVKYATGEGLAAALAAGRKKQVSIRAKGLPDKAQDLAQLCRELGERNKGEFHLGCRPAAQVLGVAPNTALSYLRALSTLGIIKLVAPPVRPRWEVTPGGLKNVTQKGEATTYAYIADD